MSKDVTKKFKKRSRGGIEVVNVVRDYPCDDYPYTVYYKGSNVGCYVAKGGKYWVDSKEEHVRDLIPKKGITQ